MAWGKVAWEGVRKAHGAGGLRGDEGRHHPDGLVVEMFPKAGLACETIRTAKTARLALGPPAPF